MADSSPRRDPDPDIRLTVVFQTGDAALIALAKSLLEGEDIDYLERGERVQDLFGWGRTGTGFNIITGPVVFLVREEDAARARELLQDLSRREDAADREER